MELLESLADNLIQRGTQAAIFLPNASMRSMRALMTSICHGTRRQPYLHRNLGSFSLSCYHIRRTRCRQLTILGILTIEPLLRASSMKHLLSSSTESYMYSSKNSRPQRREPPHDYLRESLNPVTPFGIGRQRKPITAETYQYCSNNRGSGQVGSRPMSLL